MPDSLRGVRNRRLKLVALAGLLVAVFIVDTITSYEIAAAVFYVAAILLAVQVLSRRGVVRLAIVCISLTLISFTLSRFGEHGAGIVNLAISVSAIAITTFLALRIVAAETAIHEARAQLGRLTRLTSFGALTGSIAHEVNQPLAAIVASGNAGLRWLGQTPPRLDKAQAALSRIVADGNRASTIVGNLRRLARGEPPQKVAVDLNAVLRDTLSLARQEFDRRDIEVRLDLTDGLYPLADKTQLQQVLGNLLLNAIEAIKDGQSDHRLIKLSSERIGDDAVVTIADCGRGLSTLDQEKLFGAFWTTKETGIGMGLTICRSIIEAHGGFISLDPNQPSGARVRFGLPLLEVPAA
ncbi:sensor histidine kinase [Sphingomonas sp. TX0543]|uniref:sensor histidine kinase n=1 Tax=Sphingomonas sp. TX0543 TaxID=3399682 RepID=UPI003AFA748B